MNLYPLISAALHPGGIEGKSVHETLKDESQAKPVVCNSCGRPVSDEGIGALIPNESDASGGNADDDGRDKREKMKVYCNKCRAKAIEDYYEMNELEKLR
jgi:hypothetical protein